MDRVQSVLNEDEGLQGTPSFSKLFGLRRSVKFLSGMNSGNFPMTSRGSPAGRKGVGNDILRSGFCSPCGTYAYSPQIPIPESDTLYRT